MVLLYRPQINAEKQDKEFTAKSYLPAVRYVNYLYGKSNSFFLNFVSWEQIDIQIIMIICVYPVK